MQYSKVIVDAWPFAKAMAAAIAVAPGRKDALDLVQFRVSQGTLYVCARSQREAVRVAIPTHYEDMLDRDAAFEISRNEAATLAAMKMAKPEDEEDIPRLGLLVGDRFIQRTDESGIGLGLRTVKVRRSDECYQPYLGDIPAALAKVLDKSRTPATIQMSPAQSALVAKVSKAVDRPLRAWCVSEETKPIVQTLLSDEDSEIVLSILFTKEGAENEPDVQSEPLPLEPTAKVVDANPPGGVA